MLNAGYTLLIAGWCALVIGIVIQRYQLGEFPWTFLPIPLGLLLCLGAFLALLWAMFESGGGPGSWTATVLSLLPLLVVGALAGKGVGKPPIHDVTTADEGGQPQFFWAADVRTANDNPLQRSSEAHARVHRLQKQTYDDLRPLVLSGVSPEAVFKEAVSLVEDRGWRLIGQEPYRRLEATAVTGLLRFEDDVLLEVSQQSAAQVRVDMRSVSRVGKGDLGTNYRRIRAFFEDLKQRLLS